MTGPAEQRRRLIVGLCIGLPLIAHLLLAATSIDDKTRSAPGISRWSETGVPLDAVGAGVPVPVGSVVVAINGRPIREWTSRGWPTDSAGGATTSVHYTARTPDGGLTSWPVLLEPAGLQQAIVDLLPTLPLLISLWLVAVVVFTRRPRYLPSRLVLALAFLVPFSLTDWPTGLAVADLVHGDYGRYLVNDVAAMLSWSILLLFVLVFPHPFSWTRSRPWSMFILVALPVFLYAVRLIQVTVSGGAGLVRMEAMLGLSAMAATVVPIIALLVMGLRYFHDPGEARPQLRWLLAGLASSVGLFFLLGNLPTVITGASWVPDRWLPLFFAGLPLCVGAAILQYRLFDVEVIARRSLVYVCLTAVVMVVYAAATWLLGNVVAPQVVLVASSALIALTAVPLRNHLQTLALRLVYGSRQDPYVVVSRLLAVRGEAPGELLRDIASTLATSLRLGYVGVQVNRENGTLLASGEFGRPRRRLTELPLLHGSEVVGMLRLEAGAGQEAFGPRDRQLTESIAQQIGNSGYAVLLAADLQQSRERLVQAREEERLRIRRDLHDGLGPNLAASAMQLEAVRDLVRTHPAQADDALERLHAQAVDAIGDIRRLIEDLRPPRLDELGLVSALSERTASFTTSRADGMGSRPLAVQVDCPSPLPALPAAVEVALYRITLEAINNVARHSAASICTVTLQTHTSAKGGKDVLLIILDDGIGISPFAASGIGLRSMTERAAELGGSCDITSPNGTGTLITARLPLR